MIITKIIIRMININFSFSLYNGHINFFQLHKITRIDLDVTMQILVVTTFMGY